MKCCVPWQCACSTYMILCIDGKCERYSAIVVHWLIQMLWCWLNTLCHWRGNMMMDNNCFNWSVVVFDLKCGSPCCKVWDWEPRFYWHRLRHGHVDNCSFCDWKTRSKLNSLRRSGNSKSIMIQNCASKQGGLVYQICEQVETSKQAPLNSNDSNKQSLPRRCMGENNEWQIPLHAA